VLKKLYSLHEFDENCFETEKLCVHRKFRDHGIDRNFIRVVKARYDDFI
jgi:hypothetical protein